MGLFMFLVSFFSSIAGAISGIGGGVIIKPVLDSAKILSVPGINFLASCTVLSMTIATLIRSRNSPIVLDKRISSILAIGGIAGGFLGNTLFSEAIRLFSNDAIVGVIQYVILILLTAWVLVFTLRKSRFKTIAISSFPLTLLIGILLGSLASFLGIGGGPINIAVLYLLFSMDSKKAALNSIYIIFFSQVMSIALTIAKQAIPEVNIVDLLVMMAGGITGGMIGPVISRKLSLRGVDLLFSGVMVLIIGISIYNMLGFISLVA